MSSASLIKTPPEKVRVNGWVFYTSTALILLLTAILIIAPQEAGRMLGVAQAWLSKSFGWYYMVVIAAYLVFVVGLAFSSYGKLKLGSKDDTPDFSYGAWAGMLFSWASASRCCTLAPRSRWTITSTRPKAQPPAMAPHARRCN